MLCLLNLIPPSWPLNFYAVTRAIFPLQYLKRLKQLELEFADLLTLSSAELKEEIYFAWRLGVH